MAVFWNALSLGGGLALFLFGMKVMGEGLEKCAGKRLKGLLGRLTAGRLRGLLLGAAVTALIQSSSAVTVMAVGFVNSGLMTLTQAIGIIFGANIGTTVTSWILSLTQIEGGNFFLTLLKPSSFTPILSLVGVGLLLFSKRERRRDVGGILLGFSVLMFGMERMSAAVEPLAELPAFREALLRFQNPILGLLAGVVLTAILQSSSASVGILQALASAGQITAGAAIPIIMGQNIGTCVTALISSVGAGKNAKRTAFVHFYFNVIGSVVLLAAFYVLQLAFDFAFVGESINVVGIATVHTVFNLLCTALLLPFAKGLEWLAIRTVPDREEERGRKALLDKRLLTSPALAVARSRAVAEEMAELAVLNAQRSISLLEAHDEKTRRAIAEDEARVDRMEDELGNYLAAIGSRNMSENDSSEVTAMLYQIVDFERISDHAVNLAEASDAMTEEGKALSVEAKADLSRLTEAVDEILLLARQTFCHSDRDAAWRVEPLEQVIDEVKDEALLRNIERVRESICRVEVSFLYADILHDLERIADHCSNIAGVFLASSEQTMRVHDYLERTRQEQDPASFTLQKRYRERFGVGEKQKQE